MKRHQKAVRAVSAAVKRFYQQKQGFRIDHGSTNSTRQPHGSSNTVNTGGLSNILQVDQNVDSKKNGEGAGTCLVEPNVPMDKLVATTLSHGLVPPVVMEFPGITVGGGYAGTSGESSSFKHGFFDRTIKSVEMVLGNGDIVIASPDNEYADLFNGAAGGVGSLGITTCVELELVKASPYVLATYHPVRSFSEAQEIIATVVKNSEVEFVDGIMFSPNCGAIITGFPTDQKPCSTAPKCCFSRPEDPWFYMHVQEKISNSNGMSITETIPLGEYLFRYDRGGFWVGDSAFRYTMVPNTSWTRWFLDDFLHTRMLYRALHASRQSRNYVVQDLALPQDTAKAFIEWQTSSAHFNIWPIWLCPLKPNPMPTLHPHDSRDMNAPADHDENQKLLLNIGLWGEPKGSAATDYSVFIAANRELEDKLDELGGMKWGYANHYYSEKKFWKLFDQEWYKSLRKKYHADALPTIFDKVTVDVEAERRSLREDWKLRLLSVWPFGGIYALWKSIQSGDYLLHRKCP